MILYEASMRCTYCGTRMFHKLRADEVVALQQKKPLKRPCEYCAGLTEWELLDWKGNPPSVAQAGVKSDTSGTSTAEGHPPDRILVIDDDDLTTILLGKVLEDENCILGIGNDGKEGLQKLVEQQYSLVISDIHMPGLDGKQLFRFFDAQALGSKRQIMFITGDTGSETRKFLESTGCPYVHKPIKVLQFAALVREILDANRAATG